MFNRKLFMLSAVTLAVTACGGGGGGSAAPASTGVLNIGVTDAPVDGANKVVITFTAIELKPQGGDAVVYDIPDKSIDLLTLAGGTTAGLLDNQTVPAGRYEWMRLLLDAQQNRNTSFIELTTGGQFPLYIPSGDETGLKLNRGFTVAAGGRSDFTIDFDLRSSIVAPPGQAPNYILRPVLRILDNLRVGTLNGTIPPRLIPPGCTPFIYVFSGTGVVPDDLDPAPSPDVDPLISVAVALNNVTGSYSFRVPFLEVGSYTIAFTCDGAKDAPDAEDVLVFSPTLNITVNANQTVTLSLP
jgi:hypothetical protein